MDLQLNGLKALICGATRGIGKAIALSLAREGCHLSICGRDTTTLEAALADIHMARSENKASTADQSIKQPQQFIGQPLDVSNKKDLTDWITKSAHELSGLDILIPCVSGFGTQNREQDWHTSFNIDLMSSVHAVEAALPFLKSSEHGSILFISSNCAREVLDEVFTPGHLQPYAAIKTALSNYAKNLSRSLGHVGIRTNLISPGAIETEQGGWRGKRESNHDQYQKFLASCPLKRLGQPKEVAAAASFLVSPAASYINGANLLIDGGQTVSISL